MRNGPTMSTTASGNSASTAVKTDTVKSPRLAVRTSNHASHNRRTPDANANNVIKWVTDEAERRRSGDECQQQDIETDPGHLPVLSVVVLWQGQCQIDCPRDQCDRGAQCQPVACPADLNGMP
jgi:hypothetical protein